MELAEGEQPGQNDRGQCVRTRRENHLEEEEKAEVSLGVRQSQPESVSDL